MHLVQNKTRCFDNAKLQFFCYIRSIFYFEPHGDLAIRGDASVGESFYCRGIHRFSNVLGGGLYGLTGSIEDGE